ncbi:epiphycan [Rhincodon typus]|uniref:epiphycan n=1 Tax=Rhincodon typus TaxID=259920 RepID=UPI00202E5778|nr:epiphycan [Rhincodon typus]
MKTFASVVLSGLLILEVVLAAPTKNEEKARKLKQTQSLPVDLLEEHGYVNQDPRNFFEYKDDLIIDEPLNITSKDNIYFLVLFSGLPTCLLCTCLSGSVYCDDTDIKTIPPLPKETTHFYARFNKLTDIKKGDFAGLNHLKRIDVTGNRISSIDEDAFRQLPELVDLMVASNELVQLPELPQTMVSIDASYNKLNSSGIKNEAFKDMNNLEYLYLAGNLLNHVPIPLPESLRSINLQNNNVQQINDDTFCNSKDIHYVRKALELIRLDGNPINLSKTPGAYICLPHVPYGNY